MENEKQFRLMNRMSLFWVWLSVVLVLPSAAQDQLVLSVRHDHAWGGCSGTLTLDDQGMRYETIHSKDSRNWAYDEVQQFQVEVGRHLKILTYEDRKWRFGADKSFEFDWQESESTPEQVYRFLEARVRRPIAAWLHPTEFGNVRYEFPVKHLGTLSGRQGHLFFTDRWVVLQADDRADEKGGDRTWRYDDLESISSSGPYELTLTTYEQQRFHYASRRVYRFQLKEPITPENYNALWRFVNQKKRNIETKSSGTLPDNPLSGFLIPDLLIGCGVVIPHSPIAGVNVRTVGFGVAPLGACIVLLTRDSLGATRAQASGKGSR